MTLSGRQKSLLNLIGFGLGVFGVGFVAVRLYSYSDEIDLSLFDAIDGSSVALLALIYGASNLMLARAWWHLLAFFEVRTDWRWAGKAYGLAQLAKYVPGNIFHLAGRHALGLAAGLAARPLAKSALWELCLITLAGTLIALLTIPLLCPAVLPWMSYILFGVISLALFGSLRQILSPSVAAALIWQMSFLALSGVVFIGTVMVVVPASTLALPLSALCGAYVVSWLAGLVTPGAPAGVGVRELVLLFLLGGQIDQAELLLIVVLGRAVTVTGDFVYFFIAAFWKLDKSAYA